MAIVKATIISPERLRKETQGVDDSCLDIDKIVYEIVDRYVGKLDEDLEQLQTKMLTKKLTEEELDEAALKIPLYLYFATEGQEETGVRQDYSKILKTKKYSEFYAKLEKGTIADKTSQAEQEVLYENQSVMVYTRAHRMIAQKIEQASEFVSAAKKIITKRMNAEALNNGGYATDAMFNKGNKRLGVR